MSEEEKNNKSSETKENSKKAVDTAGKAASTYFTGSSDAYNLAKQVPGAGKVVDAAGNLVSKAAEKNPALEKALNKAGNSGALDAANMAMDMNSATGAANTAGKTGEMAGKTDSLGSSSEIGKQSGFGKKSILDNDDEKASGKTGSSFGSSGSEGDIEGETDASADLFTKSTDFFKKHWIPIVGSLGMFFLIFVSLVGMMALFYGPLENVAKFINGVWNTMTAGFEHKTDEQKYYEKLITVQEKINNKYNVCVDVNLITAALTVEKEFDNSLDEGNIEEDPSESDTEALDFNRMTKQIELLANYQIKRKYYSYPEDSSECYYAEDTDNNMCEDGGKVVPVTSDNEACGEVRFYNDSSAGEFKDSSNARLVSRNDYDSGLVRFFKKKANEEKNYEYNLVYPNYINEDRNGDGVIEKYCNSKDNTLDVPDEFKSATEFAQIDVGTINDNKNSVFYWNIVENFIGDYYDEYLPEGEDAEGYPTGKRLELIEKIADKIYSLWNESGPSQTCKSSCVDLSYSALCPNGITIENYGTIPFEEYIAGVVAAEVYDSWNIEALKALAVAARTYALNRTQNCTKAIRDSSQDQNFTTELGSKSQEAAGTTAGMILTYNGNIFSSEYDSWNCVGSKTCTYTYSTTGEKHTVTISDKYLKLAAGGHGRGMSQIAAADMANNGTKYDAILKYFYKDATLTLSKDPTEEVVDDTTTDEEVVDGDNNIVDEVGDNKLCTTGNIGSEGGSEGGMDGQVVVINGTFYYPTTDSGKEGSKGSGPSGFNIYFWNRLDAFFLAAKAAGHNFSYTDAWRSYEAQQRTKILKPTLAATPGRSMHGWGIAADLRFGISFDEIKAGKDWAHANAASFGLKFAVCKSYPDNCKEDWHIEPISKAKLED
ncbi:MAG: SpoIID/LytB domain-containing protein [Bacilli bacterium]|nr:SpoIID/LytB domain-containing protein [Bacilli bacterium]